MQPLWVVWRLVSRPMTSTKDIFDYAELPPAELKGKSEKVPLFHAIAARSRFGTDLTRRHTTPLVGREIDLALLKGAFDKALSGPSLQLVTVVGEPGVGKSRLVTELFNHIDSLADLVRFRQGRCLPYGDGITFWAIGEIVKAEAGVLDSDDPDTAKAKLDQAVDQTHRGSPRTQLVRRPAVAAARAVSPIRNPGGDLHRLATLP
ncbi:MAG: AAA family ATPase [Nocardioidaceae bacterium]